jgi:hypothetical protein
VNVDRAIIADPVVKHGIIASSIILAEDHMVTAGTFDSAAPVDPSHRGVNTASAKSESISSGSGLDERIVRSSSVSLPSIACTRANTTCDIGAAT